MSVKAKFRCREVKNHENGAEGMVATVRLTPIGPDEPGRTEENAIFGKYTPSGELSMTIFNKAAAAQFVPGKNYFLTIEDSGD